MKKFILFLLTLLLMAAPAFAQKSFDMRYNEAVEYYTQKQYDQAIKLLEAAKKSPGVTKDQIAKADRLLGQCRSAKQKLGDLNLSKENLIVSWMGQRDSIYVTAGKEWSVTSAPEWCRTQIESDVLFIESSPNMSDEPRKGIIEVSMGKQRSAYVMVTQEERHDAVRLVQIRSIPERALVYIDQNSGVLSDRFSLREGKHTVRLEKSGYERKDTVLVISHNTPDEQLVFNIALEPTFAMISVNIDPEEGYTFDGVPTLDVGGNQVNLRPSTVNNFNLDKEIRHYEVYEGNVIPLYPGNYIVRAEAPGFKPETQSISIVRGQTQTLNFTLRAISGKLAVQDAENAKGASVMIDGRMVGEIPFYGMDLKTGEHAMRIEKEGFRSEKMEYHFMIEEGKETLVNVSMKPFATYRVTTDPAYCRVIVDGEYAGTTPMKLELVEGVHAVRVEKDGWYPVEREIETNSNSLENDLNVTLAKTFPLLIASDVDSLRIQVSKGMGDKKVIYAEDVKTPGTVALPLSKSPYHLKLTHGNYDTAYDGWFWFTKGNRERLKVLSYSTMGFQLVGGNLYLVKPAPYFGETKLHKGYQRMFDASLGKLKLFTGMTTSVLKGTAFWETNANESIVYPQTSTMGGDLVPGGDYYKNIKFIPALSCLFLNEEFRIGGGLHNNADIAFLATYTWYPPLYKIVPFTHMSGHDIFLGGEISSRIPVFNMNIKAGIQTFYGQANICYPDGVIKSSGNPDKRYHYEPYKVPFNNTEFVVTLGFTLGGKDSKGNNILRVF